MLNGKQQNMRVSRNITCNKIIFTALELLIQTLQTKARIINSNAYLSTLRISINMSLFYRYNSTKDEVNEMLAVDR